MRPIDRKWLRGLYFRIAFSSGVIVFSLCYITATALLTFVYDLIPFADLWPYFVLTYTATGGLSLVAIVAQREYWQYLTRFIDRIGETKPD